VAISRFGSATGSIAALRCAGRLTPAGHHDRAGGSGPIVCAIHRQGTAAVINPPSSFKLKKRPRVVADVAKMGLMFQHAG
jgi:hypothetical protein